VQEVRDTQAGRRPLGEDGTLRALAPHHAQVVKEALGEAGYSFPEGAM